MSDLIRRLEANRDALLALVGGLSDAQADRPVPGNPKWRVRDVVAHLAASEEGMLTMVQIMVAKGGYDFRPYDRDALNEERVAERAGRPTEELLAEWRRAREAMIETLRGLTEEQLAYRGSDGGSNWGEFTTRDIFETAIRHTELHLADLRRALAQEA